MTKDRQPTTREYSGEPSYLSAYWQATNGRSWFLPGARNDTHSALTWDVFGYVEDAEQDAIEGNCGETIQAWPRSRAC